MQRCGVIQNSVLEAIRSQIQRYVREDPLGHLQNLNLAQNSEFWNKGVLIQALICLKRPPAACTALSKTGSSPCRHSVLLSLRKARAHNCAAGHADGGQPPTGSVPKEEQGARLRVGNLTGNTRNVTAATFPARTKGQEDYGWTQ